MLLLFHAISDISNTRESDSSHFQTPGKELKIRRTAEYFDGLRGVMKHYLEHAFDISFQPNLILRRKRRSEIVKIDVD